MKKISAQLFDEAELFSAVQMNQIFEDGKTFPDCDLKTDLATIAKLFEKEKNEPRFILKDFVSKHFVSPTVETTEYHSDSSMSVTDHINGLWEKLTKTSAGTEPSLIPLPYPYVVPGGRFREVYYWDSYFTMLGLKASGRIDLIENMVRNFAFLLNEYGLIPNANRSYYMTRSQPPFFALMVELLAGIKGDAIFSEYLQPLLNEYRWWMDGSRAVTLEDGSVLNRYWDDSDTPRPESYREDVELAKTSGRPVQEMYRHLRAGAESGWDFSSRWFEDGTSFESIVTTDILPVDLNCLLLHLEMAIAKSYAVERNIEQSATFFAHAETRKNAIDSFMLNESEGFYYDFNFRLRKPCRQKTLAAAFPLFINIASPAAAAATADILGDSFLQKGGLTTTLVRSGQQWDAPNGWAPLQWIAFRGLKNYGLATLAEEIRTRWISANEAVFEATGKMTEKYNVFDNSAAGGGEYALQDGFGWTNGVYLAMKEGQ
ncbi:MAG: alpha,alpha-trehalase TreF [Gemmatimonadaceae bacterium]|nr:alpha,alpha-trehalase TreF [Chitinophagaceae bacterium]